MPDHFVKPEPRVATRVRAFGVRSLVSEDNRAEVPAVEAVEAVEFVATEFDPETHIVIVEGVSAVEAVEAVDAIPAHIHTSYNHLMDYDILDQNNKTLDRVGKDFVQYLTKSELNQLKGILDSGFQRAKDSIL